MRSISIFPFFIDIIDCMKIVMFKEKELPPPLPRNFFVIPRSCAYTGLIINTVTLQHKRFILKFLFEINFEWLKNIFIRLGFLYQIKAI